MELNMEKAIGRPSPTPAADESQRQSHHGETDSLNSLVLSRQCWPETGDNVSDAVYIGWRQEVRLYLQCQQANKARLG